MFNGCLLTPFFREDGKKLAPYLRVVAEELIRSANLLDSLDDDMIDFYDEVNKRLSVCFTTCNGKISQG